MVILFMKNDEILDSYMFIFMVTWYFCVKNNVDRDPHK